MTVRSPLDGVTVVELGSFVAGPSCGALLGDMGARVVKVEEPGGGDHLRSMGPLVGTESSAFVRLNRNKESVVLDLRQESGRDAYHRLLALADVVVESLRPGSADRLGIGYEAVRRTFPRVVYVAVSGWGRTGPYADRPGFDLVAQAMSGLMSVTGEPGRPPAKVGVPICDLSAGLYAAFGALAALRQRESTGEGQLVDVSLFESGTSLTIWEAAEYFARGTVPGPTGSVHQSGAPYQAVASSDGSFIVGAASQPVWERLCQALSAPELMADERFADNARRFEHREALIERIEAVTTTRSTAHWLDILERHQVPCAPVQDYAAVAADPHLGQRGFFPTLGHPTLGEVAVLANPVHLSAWPPRLERAGPLLGEDTEAVLGELGYSPEERTKLLQSGAAGTGSGA
jgi:crotonobetainyl-CoA:carnitine CoA-transferase CaiB-like acyl-CoA transferase